MRVLGKRTSICCAARGIKGRVLLTSDEDTPVSLLIVAWAVPDSAATSVMIAAVMAVVGIAIVRIQLFNTRAVNKRKLNLATWLALT
jgi:hypothetical protein